MALTKEDDAIGARIIEISRYSDGSFASARERIRTQIYDDGVAVGPPTERWVDIKDQATLAAMLGEAAASQRAHVDRVENQIQQERDAAEAEKAAIMSAQREALAAKEAEISELKAASIEMVRAQ